MTATIARAAQTTVYPLLAMRARTVPDALALTDGTTDLTFRTMLEAVDRCAAALAARGLTRGDRVAVISENRIEYALLQYAAAKLGLITACTNVRLAEPELAYCTALVEPALIVASPRYMDTARAVAAGVPVAGFHDLSDEGETTCVADPEDGLFIIYTSGTTGRPKAAVISHRAQLARMSSMRLDLGILPGDGYVAWAPMFHIGGSEHLCTALMSGAPGYVVDGFDVDRIIDALGRFPVGWLMLVPATIDPLIEALKERQPQIKGVRAVGCMADLVPSDTIAEITSLVGAPYLDSFGATETGMAPLSANLIPVGSRPTTFPKQLTLLTELRLCDPEGNEVPDGEPGEAWVRGPTVFSGYWNNDAVNEKDFADGWFHMGDMFRKLDDGYVFAGRSKYLIKSGGENIYPAEIERVLLSDSRIADAIVVKKPDEKWGEVPIAVVVPAAEIDAEAVIELCRAELAGYKRPKGVLFVGMDDLPRSVSGKILREEVEKLV
ncbi:fatty-acyl-CoA synthase [Maritimibacter alkaliphilus HTCC2654]|uniref:Putative ADP-producing CoA ligase, feruloyl-CoA synthetase-like protein n=1 Tax=Maritimibacter alkaliphilus HTCC2654 TaxID=314271 RepID=A3VK52_9RHOB|nr:AMP-binding protein [Maritimibacter alkaliphilus]EAQ11357.1 putative ADP-producing CoA ligase, feruloyl-CoA synthetase-like protein [Rhodobacterales bacterium HTCC2654] [Maritimibacter alkaliphilus HTCC2654]TYP80063.1 fatty-acyl-CoA synthase [Maritimibacter alkaliphilus HTCC2654]